MLEGPNIETVDIKAVSVRIEGRVQGVWFRGWMVQEAKACGLRGWVRNRRDGSVEGLLAGPSTAVDELIADCWKGPPAAQVRAVVVTPTALPDDADFHSLPTE